MTVNIGNAHLGDLAYGLFNSVSATANIVVTGWRNDGSSHDCSNDGCGCLLLKAVKLVVVEAAYAGIFVLGAVETLARAAASVVVGPLCLIAQCIPVPYRIQRAGGQVKWVIEQFGKAVIGGAQVSAGTTLDALCALLGNAACSYKINLYWTARWVSSDLFATTLHV
jgi:hypothetical protein